jgi:hypothetical protein
MDLLTLQEVAEERGVPADVDLAQKLAQEGVKMVRSGRPVKYGTHVSRLYIVRNQKKWAKAPLGEIVAHRLGE